MNASHNVNSNDGICIEPNRGAEVHDLVLVCMPFGMLQSPSIGLTLLEGTLDQVECSSTILYLTFPFAEVIGVELYKMLSRGLPANHDLLGEWLFSGSLFGPPTEQEVRKYVDEVLRGGDRRHDKSLIVSNRNVSRIVEELADQIGAIREVIEPFLDECLDRVLSHRPKVVGFTSVFQQHVASLSLARRIKRADPSVIVMFGGANCEGIMGLETLTQFEFVDVIVSGEGEVVFPHLIKAIIESGQCPDNLDGVYTRWNSPSGPIRNTPRVKNLDDLPMPCYQQYFRQLSKSPIAGEVDPRIPVETSRGCWWGEKSHCTFCGLNGESMGHRGKSPDRAFDEINHLARRHPGLPIDAVDNILDKRYFDTLLARLEAEGPPAELFFEIKSNVRKSQVKQLRDAGIKRVQPGIESFSDVVLRLMRKGVSGLQNIQFLKWCKEYGIAAEWNLLWGFPGEPPEEYESMAELVPLLTHLAPPFVATQIRLDRFSPNQSGLVAGFHETAPYPSYNFVYKLKHSAISNLAYFFGYDYADQRQVGSYTARLAEETLRWMRCHSASELYYDDKGTCLVIHDSRPCASECLLVLSGIDRLIYILCDEAKSLRAIAESVTGFGVGSFDLPTIERRLSDLVQRGLMVQRRGYYLSLAIPVGVFLPRQLVAFRDLFESGFSVTDQAGVTAGKEDVRHYLPSEFFPIRVDAKPSRHGAVPVAARTRKRSGLQSMPLFGPN